MTAIALVLNAVVKSRQQLYKLAATFSALNLIKARPQTEEFLD